LLSACEPEDYRGILEDSSLAVTEELLTLLEDFKQKSYTLKEMEILFENWRRKAEVNRLFIK
jgi:hypothetical protein